MPAKVKLSILGGEKKGQEFVFEEHDTCLLGRSHDCHICIVGDNQVSRHHFILEVNPPDARLRDLGSLNGTHVRGKKYGGRKPGETPEEGAKHEYPQVDLKDQDEIRVGQTLIKITVEVPLQCARCGKEIPEVDRSAARQSDGQYLCAEHRKAKIAEPEKKKPKPPEPPIKKEPKKEPEKTPKPPEEDPLAMLMRMLEQARLSPDGLPDVPGYEVEKKLGEGGMGAVYLVRHKSSGKRAALKIMRSKTPVTDHGKKLFQREIDVMRALRHPHIVDFIDQGYSNGVFYFLMEFCEGGSMEDLMRRRNRPLTLQEAGPLMLQALDGLAFAHKAGYVHRDLKPPNLLLAGTEGRYVVKICDMGLAKNFEQAGFSGMTATGTYAGTYPFMPREQIINYLKVRPVSDVWAMGATLYFMLTGQLPREFGRGQDPILAVLHNPVMPIRKQLSGIPGKVAEVIDRSLSDTINDRYPDAGVFRQALERAL